jgi:hypothetical protein
MHRRQVLAAAFAAPLLLVIPAGGSAADALRISGPVVHDNLAIYFVHGPAGGGTVPLTLDEALAKGAVKVHETGDVNQLAIENLGEGEVFIHAGDIVKGGQQDRVLTVSMLLPPKSGRVPIAAFCVEQGRWAARGGEDVKTFNSAAKLLPSREAKIAMQAPPPTTAAAGGPGVGRPSPGHGADTGSRQQLMWSAVASTQRKLSDRVGGTVAAPESRTSLQLSLESEKLKTAQDSYLQALRSAGEQDDDIVGAVFVINGRISSADVYPSNGVFRKMWHKLVSASATEAIGERKASGEAPPTVEAVRAFFSAAERGKAAEKALPVRNRQEVRDADASLYVESRRTDGAWLHRSYVAK